MKVQKDIENRMGEYNYVTPYFLSCKRFDLFKQTFESFWQNCLDKDLIRSFIVIDDNSSSDDRKKIDELIKSISMPSIFVSKNDIKGQASSINIFYDLCRTKYAIAIEDDWKFIRSGNFLKNSISIIENNSNIKRVCLDLSTSGKNINQILENDIYTVNSEKYWIHQYNNKNEWPSFTFRQCVIDINACFNDIGYASPSPKFSHDGSPPTSETDYAVRYCNHGYRTAFFINTFVEEISTNVQSSFNLNSVSRHNEYDY